MKKEVKNITLEYLQKNAKYEGFMLRPDSEEGIIKMFSLDGKTYDVYFKNWEQTEVEKIVEWEI